MSIEAISWVFDHSPTKGTDRLVLLSVANFAGDMTEGGWWESYPGVTSIGRQAACGKTPGSRIRTAQTALARLVKSGDLERVINGAPDERIPKDKRPNLYRVMTVNGIACDRPRCRWCAAHGVNDADTRRDVDGVKDGAPRGEGSRASGVKDHDATGRRNPSPKPSLEPSVEPSVEPLAMALADATGPDVSFDAFWSVYPRNAAKGNARTAWAAATKKAPPAEIIAGAERYRDDPNRHESFTAHAATWLRAERWADDPLPPRGVPRGAPPPETIDDDRGGFEGVVEL